MSARQPEDIADFGVRNAECDRFRYQLALKFAIGNPRLLQRTAEILEAVQSFFDDVNARGVTKPNRPIVSERSSRNNCDIRFAQQAIREILRGKPKLADIDQHIKRALRFDCSN